MERDFDADNLCSANHAPLPPKWEIASDRETGIVLGVVPFCPACGKPLYEQEKCPYCGQRILKDKTMEEYLTPVEAKQMDCPICGCRGTLKFIKSKYDGRLRGICAICGCQTDG